MTGGVITAAGIVMAGTFAALAQLPDVSVAEVGIAVAVGVLLDTLLVRTVLVPAACSPSGSASGGHHGRRDQDQERPQTSPHGWRKPGSAAGQPDRPGPALPRPPFHGIPDPRSRFAGVPVDDGRHPG